MLPWVLALFFGALGLIDRDVQDVGPFDPARHMLNGALLHDVVQSGNVFHPIQFAKQFYTHYPAISLPFHPPLFPLFEAALYSVFGVDPVVARVAVAITVAASALLLYALILQLNGSWALAFLTTATFLSLGISRYVASDVMLEFPCLALMLAALYCLRGFERNFSMRTGILFALFGAAAVWTKQTAVGLAFVPWVLAVLTRRRQYFREAPIWISAGILGFLSLIIFALPVITLHWTGAAGRTALTPTMLVARRFAFYFEILRHRFLLVGLVMLWGALIVAGVRTLRRSEGWFADSFYLAWIISIFALPVVTVQRDERYVLGAYPAMIALGYLMIFRVAERLVPKGWAWHPAFAAGLAICGFNLMSWPGESLSGMSSVARFVASERPARILYCGAGLDGAFLVQLRATNPLNPPIVVRADQLPPEARVPATFDEFAHQFGIDHIVLEKSVEGQNSDDWNSLPTAKMSIERRFSIFNRAQWSGELAVYRFTDPTPNPAGNLEIRSKLLRQLLNFGVGGGDSPK